ncbi:GNAT family N-acetyltransferase [Rubritalea sp.]|uniref:GNAT family N-acetyltransferase n=1 Tax=Rubritalea sp. TaxID=2109375 RepID=UPI003F4AB867
MQHYRHSSTTERHVTLLDGTPGIVRPIIPSDRDALATALEELDPESRNRRFFFNKAKLSESELTKLTTPDGIDHIAYGLAVSLEEDTEREPIAVARCFRDKHQKDLAEIAFVTADLWQSNGAAVELMRSLSAAATKVGIHRWFAVMLDNNTAMRLLLDRFGVLSEELDLGNGVIELIYEIKVSPRDLIDSSPK